MTTKERVLAEPLWKTSKQIAEELGVHRTTVNKIRIAAGIDSKANTLAANRG